MCVSLMCRYVFGFFLSWFMRYRMDHYDARTAWAGSDVLCEARLDQAILYM